MNTKKFYALILLPAALLLAVVAIAITAAFGMFMNITKEETMETETITPYAGGPISAIGEGEIPPEFIPVYEAAAKEFGVPWNLLAAIHRVETNFSTIGIENMESYAGAIGHLQFMPCTWTGWGHPSCSGLGRGNIAPDQLTSLAVVKQYGGFGMDGNGDGKADPFELSDAIYAAANYLGKSGAAKGDYRKAVFTYNHSEKYVSDVLSYMEKFVDYDPKAAIPVELIGGTGGFNRPLNTPVTSVFGNRLHPVLGIYRLHGGTDFDCVTGDPIAASKAGVVSYAGWMDASNPNVGYGLYVWVEHGGGYKTGYNHLSKLNVKVGDKVNPGDIVGACGNTGTSTGDHLHFEIFQNGKLVDPAPFLGL